MAGLDKEQHARWEVMDAQVMAWILGSFKSDIILNLRSSTTSVMLIEPVTQILGNPLPASVCFFVMHLYLLEMQ